MGDFKHADFAENLTEWGKWSQQKSDKSASSQYAAVVKDSPRVSTVRCLTFFCFILQKSLKRATNYHFHAIIVSIGFADHWKKMANHQKRVSTCVFNFGNFLKWLQMFRIAYVRLLWEKLQNNGFLKFILFSLYQDRKPPILIKIVKSLT